MRLLFICLVGPTFTDKDKLADQIRSSIQFYETKLFSLRNYRAHLGQNDSRLPLLEREHAKELLILIQLSGALIYE